MNLFTVVLLTGTLNGQGELISIKKTPTNHAYEQLKDCKKMGASMASSLAQKRFRSSGRMKRQSGAKTAPAMGIFVGMFCRAGASKGTIPSMPPSTSKQPKMGITLYQNTNYLGQRAMLYQSDRNLFDNPVKNRQASSVIIPKGCYATLYARPDFQGNSVTLYRNQANLQQTRLGDNQAMSVKMACQNTTISTASKPIRQKQAILYSKINYKGRSTIFTANNPNLKHTTVGRNTVSAVKVDEGCTLTLYSKGNYSGDKSVFYKDRANLYGTAVGDDRADSLQLVCQ